MDHATDASIAHDAWGTGNHRHTGQSDALLNRIRHISTFVAVLSHGAWVDVGGEKIRPYKRMEQAASPDAE